MLNSRTGLSRKGLPKNLLLGLGIVSVLAISSTLFSLEHDWHLLTIITLMIGGTLLFVNVRQSFATVLERPVVVNRDFLLQELQKAQKEISKITDFASRETLNQQASLISDNLQKNHFRIVIFGTGSAGKTSVINALLGRKAGKTSAKIGTTISRQEYSYQGIDFSAVGIAPIHAESKVKRQIFLLDTPGLQEMGAAGKQRELDALQLAQNSDLMVFVTAGDLTSSEYRELEHLATLGKRVILAFNKTDLYLPSDREGILTMLKSRTKNFLAEIDIVGITAQPNPIKVRQYANPNDLGNRDAAQEWLEDLPPDVMLLKQRIETILSNEWEDLLIGNTHFQIKSLLQEIKGAINQERRQDASIIINRYQFLAATTVFANPFPAIDLLAGAAINAQMLVDLAKLYDRPLNFKQAQQVALTIAQQLFQIGCVEIATSAIASFFKINALTYAIGGSMQAVTAAYLTHIGGVSFMTYLEQQPEANIAISANAEMTNKLQLLCQQTFRALQGDGFLMDFVSTISRRLVANQN